MTDRQKKFSEYANLILEEISKADLKDPLKVSDSMTLISLKTFVTASKHHLERFKVLDPHWRAVYRRLYNVREEIRKLNADSRT